MGSRSNPFIDFDEFESRTALKSIEIKIPDFQIYTSKHDGFVPLQSLTKPAAPPQNTDKRSLRGCVQCRKMYKDEDNNDDACRYHPGK